LLATGKDLLFIGFSSALSGGYATCSEALSLLEGEFPDRKILSVDSLSACLGEGLLVYLACREKQAGKSIVEVRDWVEQNKLHVAHWFTVDDLIYLFRGGRVSKTSAFTANMLNIKPVLHVDDDGCLVPMEKTMGRGKSIKKMIEHMEKSGTAPLNEQTVFICHGDCPRDAEKLAHQLSEHFGINDVLIGGTSPVIGAHSGPGTLGLFFLADRR
jgi:DegV family protein with EDD domain